MGDSAERFDVLVMGRVGVDIYPLQNGSLEKVASFGKYLGGSAANVAVAAARHGRRAALISRTGDDPFGRFVQHELTRLGVDAQQTRAVSGGQTPVTFCELFPPDSFPLFFYRGDPAPDLLIHTDDLDNEAIRTAGVFWITATGLSRSPSADAHLAALALREGAQHTVLDLDYRASLWPSAARAHDAISAALERVSVAVGNREECQIAVGEDEPMRAADALLERGVTLAVIKRGPYGVLAKTADEVVEVAPTPVTVVNGLGAGDAFGGALSHGLLSGWDLAQCVTFASAAGAIVAGRRECSSAMPTTAEVNTVIRQGSVL